MNDYHQPSFYRFNEDSIKLIRFVLEKNITAKDILDLGSGSGILGIEISNALLPKSLCLVEGQQEWLEYLEKNVEHFLNKRVSSSICLKTFGNWVSVKRYDLIVCNPPYYLPGHGRKSDNELRNNARTFMIDGWNILMEKINDSLAEEGRAYLVVKDDPRILSEIYKNAEGFNLLKEKENGIILLELSRLNKN